MNVVALTLFQLRYVNKAFWRNPASAFFTFTLPLMFLIIFTALLGSGRLLLGGRMVHQSTYYVAAMGAFSVITACYNNLAVSLCFQRDAGILKRTNGTPLPGGVYFSARVLHALGVAVLLVAITVGFGRLVYQAEVPTGASLARFLVILTVGAMSFCALGFAITAAIPNTDAAAPIVYATILPLLFLSGIFIPMGDNTPAWGCAGAILTMRYFSWEPRI
jgi:ABC-2 type transport system permease protein